MTSSKIGAGSSLEEILALQRHAMTGLLRSQAIAQGSLDEALEQITEAAANVLSVHRASVWRVDPTRTRIDCLDLFDSAANGHQHGASIHRADVPNYFEAALKERCIVAHDAQTDPRTCEFRATYLEPNGITSMLDAPILVRGEVVGVICHEHIGPMRTWQPWEELAAATLADVVGMAMSAAEHAEQRRELDVLRGNLESLVAERTRELSQSRENVHALFATSPVALVLTRAVDQTVLLANERAAAMFGVDLETVRGMPATDYWVRPEDRATMIERVRKGVHEELDAELKTASGRHFWGSVSAASLAFDGERAILVGVHDITTKKLAEEALRKNEEVLRSMLEAAPTPLVVTGLDDAIVRFTNTRAADMFGISVEELVGRRAPDFYENPEDRTQFISMLQTAGRVDSFATRLRGRDGRSFWALLSARTMVLSNARVFMVGFSDLTEQKEIEHRLRNLASVDGLTGVFNRRHFFEAASAAMTVAERRGRGSCIAILDVDHFKAVNDLHGHAAGDEALKALTRVCTRMCRDSDVVARYGGEEFVMLLPETTLASARAVVERIRHALCSEHIKTAAAAATSDSFTITVSAGVAAHREGETLEDLLRRADEALYEAKRTGRDRVVDA